jgi:hypothetical protein
MLDPPCTGPATLAGSNLPGVYSEWAVGYPRGQGLWFGTMKGEELRALRESAGLGLRELADLLGRSHTHLSLIERGERPATAAIVSAYRVTTEPSTVDSVERRKLLASGMLAPLARRTPQRVGAAEVVAVRHAAVHTYARSPYALDLAQFALTQAKALLGSPMSSDQRTAVLASIGLLADEIAWAQSELGIDPSETLATARKAASDSGDRDLLSLVLLNTAMAVDNDRQRAARIAERAAQVATSGASRVNALAVAARLSPDPVAAHQMFVHATSVDPTIGASIVAERSGAAWVDATVAAAAFDVDAADASDRLAHALNTLPSGSVRARARTHARLGVLAIRQRDVDAAEHHLGKALIAPRTRLVVRELNRFAAEARRVGLVDLASQAV